MHEFRARNLKLVVNDRDIGANPKVSNLANMAETAEHDVLVIADSDISVGRDYVRSVVAPLADPNVGLVTCLYGGTGARRIWGVLGQLFIDDWFFPSALISATGGVLRHGFGATLVVRRRTLEAIGGFAALGPYLADDYMLGALVARQGRRVVLSRYVIATRVVESTFRALFVHELRWSRTMRAVRPIGYFLAASTYGLVWSALAVVTSRGAVPALAVAAVHVGARLAVHRAVRPVLPSAARFPAWGVWLLPVRDALSLVLWAASFVGRTVRWGQSRFAVDGHGRIQAR
jgi:ceramide glucosyltransferase